MAKVQDWRTEDVAKWFASIGCEQYTALVLKEDLDGGLLVRLQDQELLDFGIKNSFHRKKILTKIAKLLRPENCIDVKMPATTHVGNSSIEDTLSPFSRERKQKRPSAVTTKSDSGTKSSGNRHRTWNDWGLQQSTHIAWSNSKSLQPSQEESGALLASKTDITKSDSLLMTFSKSYEKSANYDLEQLTYTPICPVKYPYLLEKGASRSILVCNIDYGLSSEELYRFFSNCSQYPIRNFKCYLPKCPMTIVTYFDISHAVEIQERLHGCSFQKHPDSSNLTIKKAKHLPWCEIDSDATPPRGEMVVFPCIPTHAIYKEWNDGAIAVEVRASDGIFKNIEKTLKGAFSIYGPLLYQPKQINNQIKKDTRAFIIQFADTRAADRALTFVPFVIENMKVVSRNYVRPSTTALKAMFMFASELEKLACSCENMTFMPEWCAKATQVALQARYNHMLPPKTKICQELGSYESSPTKVPCDLREVGPFLEARERTDMPKTGIIASTPDSYKRCAEILQVDSVASMHANTVVSDSEARSQSDTNLFPHRSEALENFSPTSYPTSISTARQVSDSDLQQRYIQRKGSGYNIRPIDVDPHQNFEISSAPVAANVVGNGNSMPVFKYNENVSVACFGAPAYSNFTQPIAPKYGIGDNGSEMYLQQQHILPHQNYMLQQRQFEAYGSNSHQPHHTSTKKSMAKAIRESRSQQKPRHHSKHALHTKGRLHNTNNDGKVRRANYRRTDNKIHVGKLRSKADARCTLCVKNIPNRLTKSRMLEFLDLHFKKSYDYFYLPVDFQSDYNVGYCFINFLSTEHVIKFYTMYHGSPWSSLIKQSNSAKVLEVCYADQQGKRNMIKRQFNSNIRTMPDKYQPSLFVSSGPLVGEKQDFATAKKQYKI